MNTTEAWNEITSKPKWYAGIKTNSGSFHTAQSANRLKNRFKKGLLTDKTISYILKEFGYVKEEIKWRKIYDKH